jgi:UDP-glucuronate decarboxylase
MELNQKNDIVSKDIEEIVEDLKENVELLENAKVLLIGGKGFLGTYFLKTLLSINKILSKPAKIVVIDNLITSKNNEPNNEPNVEFIQADISQKISFDYDFDYIIHSASIASPPIYRKFPIKTIDVNYQGTRNLLDFAKETNLKGMLYLSSSEIYGDPHVIPTPEDYWGYVSNTGPRSCYDESKRLAETICVMFNQQFKIPVKIVRPFNVYGPYLNLDDGRVIPDFMKGAIKNSKIIMHSDGSPTRSFCYVTDAMRAFFRVLLLAPSGSIYNVGNDEEISMKGLAEKIQRVVKKQVSINMEKSDEVNYLKDNPQRRCPDLSKIKNDVKYFPKIKTQEGIERIHKWYTGIE